MKSAIVILSLGLSLLTPQLRAGDAPKKPGPEHKKLEILTGKWKWEETSEKTPFGLAGKSTHRSERRFIHGGFFLESQGKGRAPDGPYSWTTIYYYDPDNRAFRLFSCDNTGVVSTQLLTIEGSTMTTTWEQQADGKNYRCKEVSINATDGQSCTYEWSYSGDGVTWKPWLKGTGRKVGKAK